MEVNGPTKRAVTGRAISGMVMLSIAMLFSILIPTQSAEASSSTSPCPRYSIQDVFDDPSGNWDGDQVNNSDELYNGLNPCIVDTHDFCQTGTSLCTYYYGYTDTSNGQRLPHVEQDIANDPCHRSAFTRPYDDYDRDGVNNTTELARGTDPCVYNAPVRVYYVATVCPHYDLDQVTASPRSDWDGDGVTNLNEWIQGTNPCVANHTVVYQAPRVQTTTYRLPHVVNTYAAPTRQVVQPLTRPLRSAPVVTVPARTCPAGYPYFHPANGQCYANPVKQLFS